MSHTALLRVLAEKAQHRPAISFTTLTGAHTIPTVTEIAQEIIQLVAQFSDTHHTLITHPHS